MAVVKDRGREARGPKGKGGEERGRGESQGGTEAQEKEREAYVGSLPDQDFFTDDVVGLQNVSKFPTSWFCG